MNDATQQLVATHWNSICTGGQLDLAESDADDAPEWATYDGAILESGGREYLVLTDDEANKRTRERIEESLWGFVPESLASMTGIDKGAFEAIQANEKCEDNNPVIRSMIDGTCGMDDFVEAAIAADGRGHFLSSYDGEEHEIVLDGTYLYFYRIN